MFNTKVFDPTRDYTVVWDFDAVLFPAITLTQKDSILVRHKETNTTREFDNVTAFRGRTVKDPLGCAGSWLKGVNDQRETNDMSPFLIEDFEVSKAPKICADDSAAKKFINSSIEKLLLFPWVNKNRLKLVIEGEGNFRNDVAFTLAYKSNRGKKPLRFEAIRSWFIDKYKDNVLIAEGQESDDIVNIFGYYGLANNDSVVRVFIDKDHLQTPGWYFDNRWFGVKDTPEYIGVKEAQCSLHSQVLVGDPVDSIPGIPRVGKETANAILSECKDEKEMMLNVMAEYIKYYGSDDWLKILREQFCLVKLLEKKYDQYENIMLSYDYYYNKVFGYPLNPDIVLEQIQNKVLDKNI